MQVVPVLALLALVPACLGQCPGVDLCFVVESSRSIVEPRLDNWKYVVKPWLEAFLEDERVEVGPHGAHVGIVSYGKHAAEALPLSSEQSKMSILESIDNLPFMDGAPDLYQGLNTSRHLCVNGAHNRHNLITVTVIVTTGMTVLPGPPHVAESKALHQASLMKAPLPPRYDQDFQPSQVFSVGLSTKIDERMLASMSSDPQKINMNWFEHPSPEAIDTIIKSYCPQEEPARDGHANSLF